MVQEEISTISHLKKELDRPWKLLLTALGKEEKANSIVRDLRAEIADLRMAIEGSSQALEINKNINSA